MLVTKVDLDVQNELNDWFGLKSCAEDLKLLVVAKIAVGHGLVLTWKVRWASDGDGLLKDLGAFSGTIHIFVLVHLPPVQTHWFLYLALTPVPNSVKVTLHPALQNLTAEMRERDASPGTM